jgi:hypothetical protein
MLLHVTSGLDSQQVQKKTFYYLVVFSFMDLEKRRLDVVSYTEPCRRCGRGYGCTDSEPYCHNTSSLSNKLIDPEITRDFSGVIT